MIVVAVASGTSADGLDVGVVELTLDRHEDGVDIAAELIETRTRPWPGRLREELLTLLPPATTTAENLCTLDQQVGQAVADVVVEVIGSIAHEADREGRAARTPELVVSPGQTVYHDVRDGICLGTLQLGQPAWIAERTGLPVVSDLRARDVAAGGHGAPLASTLDALWLQGTDRARAALNLGGIANVTVVPAAGSVIAWDTGPANCLIDVAVGRVTNGRQTFDRDGELARRGRVDGTLLDTLLSHPHFGMHPPVSTGREAFSAAFLETALERTGAVEIAAEDLVATVTELTAVSVAQALTAYDVAEVVASGGGTSNPALMDRLRNQLDAAGTDLTTSAEHGIPPDSKEALLWALLGFLSWHGLPGATTATGAAEQRILGRLSPGHRPLRLPDPVEVPVRRLRVVESAATRGRTVR